MLPSGFNRIMGRSRDREVAVRVTGGVGQVADQLESGARTAAGVAVVARRGAGRHQGGSDERVLGPVVDVGLAGGVLERRVVDRRRIGVAVVDGVALDTHLDAVDTLLDRGVLGLAPLAEEHRDGDGRQDADDDDHDQQFDEGETVLVHPEPRRSPCHADAFRLLCLVLFHRLLPCRGLLPHAAPSAGLSFSTTGGSDPGGPKSA